MSHLYVIGGPNGAGKTTTAMQLLPELLNCEEYINADSIAKGLAPFKPESVAIQAGKLMLSRLHELANKHITFAFETTMASRSFVKLLTSCKEKGYIITMAYIWLRSPELAKQRVLHRVRTGGHDIPGEDVIRRYYRGLRNFYNLYQPLADHWVIYDNSLMSPILIAKTDGPKVKIANQELWQQLEMINNEK